MTRIAIFSVLLASSSLLARAQDPVQVPAGQAAPAAQSAPTGQAPVTSTASTDVQRFQKIEDSWSDAVNLRDQYGLELVLSPLFVDISAGGDISTRNQMVAGILSLEDKTLRIDQKVITVRMLGDVAVANGTYVLHHKAATGSAQVDDKGVFTHVFERVRGGWVCVNSQRTMVRVTSNAKPKKQSNADLPFHIPIFSK
jgi:ketosteroid isomerase-like protein